MWMWWQMHWTTSNQLYLEHGQICHFYNFSVLQASERTLKFNCDVAEIPSNNPLSRVATYLDTTMLLPISKRLSRKSEIRKEKQQQLFYAICWALTLWITNVPPKRIATAIGGVRRLCFSTHNFYKAGIESRRRMQGSVCTRSHMLWKRNQTRSLWQRNWMIRPSQYSLSGVRTWWFVKFWNVSYYLRQYYRIKTCWVVATSPPWTKYLIYARPDLSILQFLGDSAPHSRAVPTSSTVTRQKSLRVCSDESSI